MQALKAGVAYVAQCAGPRSCIHKTPARPFDLAMISD